MTATGQIRKMLRPARVPGEASPAVTWPRLTDTERQVVQQAGVPVSSSHPAKFWVVSFDAESVMPTAHELRLMRAYIEFRCQHTFAGQTAQRLAAMHLPLVRGGTVTRILSKRGHEDWCWRQMTWRSGPLYVPAHDDPRRPLTLDEMLCDAEKLSLESWRGYLAGRPELTPWPPPRSASSGALASPA